MLWALFLSSLLSATLLPGGSEALLLYQLQQGANTWLLVVVAGGGNLLGSLITYGVGFGGNRLLHHPLSRRFAPSPQRLAHAERHFNRWGSPALLFTWLPVVGDPITLVAGVLRTPLLRFIPLVAIGKFGRYATLVLLAHALP